MKLYTEEQVRIGIKSALDGFGIGDTNDTIDIVVFKLPYIELPTDEEIKKQVEYIAHNYFDMHNTNHYQGLKQGAERMAEWIKSKIQGGSK